MHRSSLPCLFNVTAIICAAVYSRFRLLYVHSIHDFDYVLYVVPEIFGSVILTCNSNCAVISSVISIISTDIFLLANVNVADDNGSILQFSNEGHFIMIILIVTDTALYAY